MRALRDKVKTWRRKGDGFLYQHIADDLCARITQREWAVGGRIPGRLALAQEYGVDLTTIQPAVSHLLEIGLLQTVGRKGTYVARGVTPVDYWLAKNTPLSVATPPSSPAITPFNTLSAPSLTTPIVGVLMLGGYAPDDTSPETDHWGNIAALAIERSLSEMGGRAYFEHISPSPSDDIHFTHHTVNTQIIIDTYGMLSKSPDYIVAFEECGIPTVVVSAEEILTKMPFVTYDQQYVGFLAAEHLIQCGYQEIVFYRPFTARWVEERLLGVRAALARYQWSPEKLLLYPASPVDEMTYYNNFLPGSQVDEDETVDRSTRNDAVNAQGVLPYLDPRAHRGVIALNDSRAFSVMAASQAEGIIAGQDYGIVGFDDHRRSRSLGLTTFRVPLDAMGSEAVRMVKALLHHEAIQYKASMRSSLIQRSTTRPASY